MGPQKPQKQAFCGCDQGCLVLPVRPSGNTLYSFKPHMWIRVIWTNGGGCTCLPHTLFCLSLVCCIVTRAHSAGRLVCMLSLIIASGKTTFLYKSECITDCMCCDRQADVHRQPRRWRRHWLSLWQLSLRSSFQTLRAIIFFMEVPLRSLRIWPRRHLDSSQRQWTAYVFFSSVDWNWCKYCFLNALYSPSVNRKKVFTQMDRSDR